MSADTKVALPEQWRKRARELCERARQLCRQGRKADANELNVRAQVYFSCAAALDTQTKENAQP